MNYKKIIKNKSLRLKIINMFNFIPDKPIIRLQYRIKTGRKLNLKNPKRYTEKLQWYKLYYRHPLLTQCSDKYAVRQYLNKKGYEGILNELYGVYNSVDEINFDSLPHKFAIKVNNSSGTNIFINDKSLMDESAVRKQLKNWMERAKGSYGREWCYHNIKPKITIEKLIDRDSNNDLPDYKFFCFNGKVFCLYTMIDYIDDHSKGKLGFYDLAFNKIEVRRTDYSEILEKLEKPRNFEKMIEIAEDLSKEFPHVRVDFYNIDGKIIFGEFTFYNASGYTSFRQMILILLWVKNLFFLI